MAKKPYNFTMTVEGDDLVLRGGRATRYGGVDDDQDNGVGAGGFDTARNHKFLGISLPIRCRAGGLIDSPIPKLPLTHADGTGGIPCAVYSRKTKKTVTARLEDIGPSRVTGRVADLMNSVVLALGLDLADGVYEVDVRVLGGAAFLPKA